MQYLLMIYRNEAEFGKMDATARQKMTAEYGAFTQSIIQSGHFKAGDGLQPTTTATTVRVRDGKTLTTDGPFAETREQLGATIWSKPRISTPRSPSPRAFPMPGQVRSRSGRSWFMTKRLRLRDSGLAQERAPE